MTVEEAHPDFSEAHACFHVLRARSFAVERKEFEHHRDELKPEIVWNIEAGLKLTGEDIVRAERQRFELFKRAVAFFERYDLLLTPATIVPAFPVEQRYVESCAGRSIRQLLRVAGDRLCDYPCLLPGPVVAVRLHQRRSAGRTADRRTAAR